MRVPWGNGRFERVLVYGLGLSGRAAAHMLLSRGVSVVAVDAKTGIDVADLETGAVSGKAKFEILSGTEPQELPPPAGSIDAVIVSPGVPMDRPLLEDARRRGVPVIAEVELAAPFLNGPVVAITGSNGKSTTTALTGAMLRAAGHRVEVCGNIGEPLAGKIDGPPGRVFVVELSSFQIDGIVTLKPRAAALLNLSEDHLDRYGSMALYAASKKRLFLNQDGAGIAVLNADDPEAADVETQARKRYFSRRVRVEDGCYLLGASSDGRVIEVTPGEPDVDLFRASDVPLAGVHNLENAMAAALLARAIGAEPAELRAGLAGFKGLPHRMERVGESGGHHGGVLWYDDSKGTNPGATAKSLEGFDAGTVHLILGGRNKGADLASLVPILKEKVRRAYLIGEAAEEFEKVLSGTVELERSGTMARAVESAAAAARPGEAVVLSPACASFDQFRNFVHRGQVFQDLVRKRLIQEGGPNGEEAGL